MLNKVPVSDDKVEKSKTNSGSSTSFHPLIKTETMNISSDLTERSFLKLGTNDPLINNWQQVILKVRKHNGGVPCFNNKEYYL